MPGRHRRNYNLSRLSFDLNRLEARHSTSDGIFRLATKTASQHTCRAKAQLLQHKIIENNFYFIAMDYLQTALPRGDVTREIISDLSPLSATGRWQ